ncbi:MAG: UDP-N-acetylmuramate--L-alanine ligase [Clostridia bacterium]|nr:UDP-N-acetylmuramate--L-alanine ligase [Clostridia bacterium]
MSDFSINQLPKDAKIHMIGIGGVSMSGIASMLIHFGYKVSGSDAKSSEVLEELMAKGAEIYIGQRAENITNPDLVCYTAAIQKDNPELVAAIDAKIPTIERAELLGELMTLYKYPLAVAGTHGKTTVTSMLSLVLLEAKTDPTILVGGELPQIGGNHRIGKRDYLSFEACEYVESFLHFNPFLSIITNVEEDHLDYFSGINHIISSFKKFASLTSPLGCIIVCSDDKYAQEVVQNVDKKVIKYGIKSEDAEISAKNLKFNDKGFGEFDIVKDGKILLSVKLNVPGEHNVCNALAVTAAADFLGIGADAIKAGLEAFGGARRRFERIGSFGGCEVIDDYAHHPTEIKTTLEAARKMGKKRVWVVFQPHTYSRTKSLLDGFAEALPVADKVVICDIFPAREKDDGSIHSRDLADKIPDAVYIGDLDAAGEYLKENTEDGDMLITMGAGDVYKIGYKLCGKQ